MKKSSKENEATRAHRPPSTTTPEGGRNPSEATHSSPNVRLRSPAKADEALLSLLEETAKKLGIEIQTIRLNPKKWQRKETEPIIRSGGYSRNGKSYILLDRNLTTDQKIEILEQELRLIPLDGIHLPPVIRDRLENANMPR